MKWSDLDLPINKITTTGIIKFQLIMLFPSFTSSRKKGWDYLKQGLLFTVFGK